MLSERYIFLVKRIYENNLSNALCWCPVGVSLYPKPSVEQSFYKEAYSLRCLGCGMGDAPLKLVTSTIFLSVLLTLAPHIGQRLIPEIDRCLNQFYLYSALIWSKLEYGCQVMARHRPTVLGKLNTIHYMFAYLYSGASYHLHRSECGVWKVAYFLFFNRWHYQFILSNYLPTMSSLYIRPTVAQSVRTLIFARIFISLVEVFHSNGLHFDILSQNLTSP